MCHDENNFAPWPLIPLDTRTLLFGDALVFVQSFLLRFKTFFTDNTIYYFKLKLFTSLLIIEHSSIGTYYMLNVKITFVYVIVVKSFQVRTD